MVPIPKGKARRATSRLPGLRSWLGAQVVSQQSPILRPSHPTVNQLSCPSHQRPPVAYAVCRNCPGRHAAERVELPGPHVASGPGRRRFSARYPAAWRITPRLFKVDRAFFRQRLLPMLQERRLKPVLLTDLRDQHLIDQVLPQDGDSFQPTEIPTLPPLRAPPTKRGNGPNLYLSPIHAQCQCSDAPSNG